MHFPCMYSVLLEFFDLTLFICDTDFYLLKKVNYYNR